MLGLRLALRRCSAALLVLASACATNTTTITGIGGPVPPSSLTPRQTAFLDTLEQRTFNWFWERTDPNTGLTPDRWPTNSFSSVAAIGFALTAYPVGVERGYVSRADAAQRALNTLRFMYNAPQGPQPANVTGYKGFFYHFLDMQTGYRFQQVELSTIDTSLLLGGVLFCQSYFTGADPTENAIRAYADSIYLRIDWQWAVHNAPLVSMGWHPESGFINSDWKGYDEGMIVYILALGLSKDRFVQYSSTFLVVAATLMTIALGGMGALGWADVLGSSLAVIPILVGMKLGAGLRALVSPPVFRTLILAVVMISGLHMIAGSVTSAASAMQQWVADVHDRHH